jgi:hypothetical protein
MIKLSRSEYWLKLFAILLASLTPVVCYMVFGYLPSFSAYWKTDAQPAFIISNVTTAYFLLGIAGWRLPAIFLILLTAFSTDRFCFFHDILAILFFISTFISIFKTDRYAFLLFFYIIGLILLPFSLLYAEFIFINIICVYHLIVLHRLKQIFL